MKWRTLLRLHMTLSTIQCRKNACCRKLPDAGEDAASKVDASLSEAERKGRAENAQKMKERKDRGMDAFGAALQKHLTNASTCVGVVGVKSFNEPGSTGK